MKVLRRLAPPPAPQPGMTPSLDCILAAVRSHHPDTDAAQVERAYAGAAFWHEGQKRHSGDPFITHCLTVAAIVADLRMPAPVVVAALLHDVEDTACPPRWLADQFGQETANLVAAVRTAKLVPPSSTHAAQTAEPPTAGPSQETAVLAIRLADRLHNMRTIAFVAQPKRHLKARETLDVFAPVARAAGLEAVGRELQDLAATVLQPAPRSYRAARRLLAALTLLLPAPQRERWKEEWSAELAAHATRRSRMGFTLHVLFGAPRLSMTLRLPACRERRR